MADKDGQIAVEIHGDASSLVESVKKAMSSLGTLGKAGQKLATQFRTEFKSIDASLVQFEATWRGVANAQNESTLKTARSFVTLTGNIERELTKQLGLQQKIDDANLKGLKTREKAQEQSQARQARLQQEFANRRAAMEQEAQAEILAIQERAAADQAALAKSKSEGWSAQIVRINKQTAEKVAAIQSASVDEVISINARKNTALLEEQLAFARETNAIQSKIDAQQERANRQQERANRPQRTGPKTVPGQNGYNIRQAGETMLWSGASGAAVLGGLAMAASQFNAEMYKAVNNTTLTNAQVKELRGQVIALAKQSDQPIDDIFVAARHVSDFGYKGADAMKVLTAANMAAVASGAKISDVAGAAAQVMHLYGVKAGEAAQFINALKGATDQNNLTFADFIRTSGRGFEQARVYGVSATEAAAAMAVLTKNGYTATQSATAFRSIITAVSQPTKKALEEVKALSVAHPELANAFSQSGLRALSFTGVLNEVAKATDGNLDELGKLFPGVKSGSAAYGLLTVFMKDYIATLNISNQRLRDNTNIQGQYATQLDQANVKMGQLRNYLVITAASFQDELLPALKDAVDFTKQLLDWFTALPAPLKHLAVDVAVAATAFNLLGGGILYTAGRVIGLVTGFGDLIARFPGLKTGLGSIAKLLGKSPGGVAAAAGEAEVAEGAVATSGVAAFAAGGALILAIGGLIFEIYKLKEAWNGVRDAQNQAADSAKNYAAMQGNLSGMGERDADLVELQKVNQTLSGRRTAASYYKSLLANPSKMMAAGETAGDVQQKLAQANKDIAANEASAAKLTGRMKTLDANSDVPASVKGSSIPATIYAVGKRMGVSDKIMLAAMETGLVESNMTNMPGGDRDSAGVFQQRPSQGWGTKAQVMNPAYAAQKFFKAAMAKDDPNLSAGELAQKVQGSLYPLRYGQRQVEAEKLMMSLTGTPAALPAWAMPGGGTAHPNPDLNPPKKTRSYTPNILPSRAATWLGAAPSGGRSSAYALMMANFANQQVDGQAMADTFAGALLDKNLQKPSELSSRITTNNEEQSWLNAALSDTGMRKAIWTQRYSRFHQEGSAAYDRMGVANEKMNAARKGGNLVDAGKYAGQLKQATRDFHMYEHEANNAKSQIASLSSEFATMTNRLAAVRKSTLEAQSALSDIARKTLASEVKQAAQEANNTLDSVREHLMLIAGDTGQSAGSRADALEQNLGSIIPDELQSSASGLSNQGVLGLLDPKSNGGKYKEAFNLYADTLGKIQVLRTQDSDNARAQMLKDSATQLEQVRVQARYYGMDEDAFKQTVEAKEAVLTDALNAMAGDNSKAANQARSDVQSQLIGWQQMEAEQLSRYARQAKKDHADYDNIWGNTGKDAMDTFAGGVGGLVSKPHPTNKEFNKVAQETFQGAVKNLATNTIKASLNNLVEKTKGLLGIGGGKDKTEMVALTAANMQFKAGSMMVQAAIGIQAALTGRGPGIPLGIGVGSKSSGIPLGIGTGALQAHNQQAAAAVTNATTAIKNITNPSSGGILGKILGTAGSLGGGNLSRLLGSGLGGGLSAAMPWVGAALSVAGLAGGLSSLFTSDIGNQNYKGQVSTANINTDWQPSADSGYSGASGMNSILATQAMQTAQNSSVIFHPGSISMNVSGATGTDVNDLAYSLADAVQSAIASRTALDNAATGTS